MKYRKIDAIVETALGIYTNSGSTHTIARLGIPAVADQVSLVTEMGSPMLVEVVWISEGNKTLRGKVTYGYYPQNKADWVSVGDLVEFSINKIAGIHRK
jgi:hypothetical protein